MKNHRSLEAHNFFSSGWVQTVYSHRPEGSEHMILKADVKPSWRVTETPHHTWVAAKMDGTIDAAHCDCMAGLGESCSHVGAILFKLEAAVRLGFTSVTCTDVPCEWNNHFVKKVEAAKIKDIMFYSQTSKEKLQKSKRQKKGPVPKATPEDQKELLEMLAGSGENPIGLSTWAQYSGPFEWKREIPAPPSLPNSLRNLYQSNLTQPTVDEVTQEQILLVEEATLEQASSMAWHQQRAGRVTASVAHRVLHTSMDKPSVSLIKQICKPNMRPIQKPWILWGKDKEGHGMDTYTYALGLSEFSNKVSNQLIVSDLIAAKHDSVKVENAGFRICKAMPYMGVSCDGYVFCTCCGAGVIEIKCPYNWGQNKDFLPEEWVQEKTGHLESMTSLKPSHTFYTQVQMQMFVCETQYADFITWTPQACVMFRVMRNDAFIGEMIEKITNFWAVHLFPELTTRALEMAAEKEMEENNTKDTCPCGLNIDNTEMISCDYCDQWWHFLCKRVKRAPKGSWFCSKECQTQFE